MFEDDLNFIWLWVYGLQLTLILYKLHTSKVKIDGILLKESGYGRREGVMRCGNSQHCQDSEGL